MTGRDAHVDNVAADVGSRPIRLRRQRRRAGGEPADAADTLTPSDTNGFKAKCLRAFRTAAGTAALLPLDAAGCDGRCAVPAFYDHTTKAWRHLTDLSRCHRPGTTSTGSNAINGTATPHTS